MVTICVHACMLSGFSHVQLFVTLGTLCNPARLLCPWGYHMMIPKLLHLQTSIIIEHWFIFCLKTSWKTYWFKFLVSNTSVQFSSVIQSCPTLCHPMDCRMPGLPVHHQLPEFTQIHDHWVGDTIQTSHSLLSPFPPAFNLSQHQGFFFSQGVSSSHQVAKVLEFELQHQSFQWIFRIDLL